MYRFACRCARLRRPCPAARRPALRRRSRPGHRSPTGARSAAPRPAPGATRSRTLIRSTSPSRWTLPETRYRAGLTDRFSVRGSWSPAVPPARDRSVARLSARPRARSLVGLGPERLEWRMTATVSGRADLGPCFVGRGRQDHRRHAANSAAGHDRRGRRTDTALRARRGIMGVRHVRWIVRGRSDDRRDQAITALGDGLDVRGRARVVTERAPQLDDALGQRLVADHHAAARPRRRIPRG